MRAHRGLLRWGWTGLSLLAFVLAVPLSVDAQGQLTVVSFGGSYQEAQRKAFFEPFAKAAGVKIIEDEWAGQMAKLRAMVQSGNVTWDVLSISDGQLPLACDEGLVEKLDISQFGGKENFLPGWTHPCGVGTTVASILLGYNAAKFPKGEPKTLADFWDVKQFPGPRAMKKWPKHNLEFALLADGVSPSELYKVLGTDAGIARAFKKLDEIKPHVKVWFDTWAQPQQLLADGEVYLSTGTNGRLAVAAQSNPNIKMIWDRNGQGGDLWSIVKGAKNRANAIKFIQFASDPKNAAELPKYIQYAPPITGALARMAPDLAVKMPTAPQNLKTAWIIDSGFWGDHLDDLEVRFQAWLAR
jgi:putative spermidine/putrescine transport system substrate-binding protein